jgi:hypothetical protein
MLFSIICISPVDRLQDPTHLGNLFNAYLYSTSLSSARLLSFKLCLASHREELELSLSPMLDLFTILIIFDS